MADELPGPIAAWFEASNAHDADAAAAGFADDARVHDEGQERVGRAAIRAWAEETYGKYNQSLAPGDVRRDGDTVVVRTKVAGTFPGSPIEIDFRFRLAGGKIAALNIG